MALKNFKKLVVGGWYLNRNGTIIGPVEQAYGNKVYTFISNRMLYTEGGGYCVSGDESQFDLITRIEPPQTVPYKSKPKTWWINFYRNGPPESFTDASAARRSAETLHITGFIETKEITIEDEE